MGIRRFGRSAATTGKATDAQEPPAPRSYSIASIPQDGRLHLLVRQTWRDDGTPGQASHWLTTGLDVGATLTLQLRAHPGFRLEGNAQRPLILIGNGTGLAGLRAHLRTRAALGQHANWLIAGERQAAHDQLYGAELHAWHATGHLQHLDWAFSRDGDAKTYVQDRLHQHANRLREWVQTRGAALYVCGSLHGMAEGGGYRFAQHFGQRCGGRPAAARPLSARCVLKKYRRTLCCYGLAQ